MTTELAVHFLWIALFIGVGLGAMLFVIYSLSTITKYERKVRKGLKCPCDYIGNVTINLAEDSVDSSIKVSFNTDFETLCEVISKKGELTLQANIVE